MSKEKLRKEIGLRVMEIREKKMHMTKKKFASLINMKSQYLGTVESGQRGLTVEKVVEICKVSGVSADYILFGESANNKAKTLLANHSSDDIDIAFKVIKDIANMTK